MASDKYHLLETLETLMYRQHIYFYFLILFYCTETLASKEQGEYKLKEVKSRNRLIPSLFILHGTSI